MTTVTKTLKVKKYFVIIPKACRVNVLIKRPTVLDRIFGTNLIFAIFAFSYQRIPPPPIYNVVICIS